jgi:hypothetical protein
MTDARMPEKWLTDRRLLRLDDATLRLFVLSLMWSVANRTDGRLYDDDLDLIPTVDATTAPYLVKAGLWRRENDYWVITDWADTQTSADELAALAATRRAARDRKARERARKAAVTRDPSRDASRDVTRDHTGQDRQGQDRTGNKEEPATEWP